MIKLPKPANVKLITKLAELEGELKNPDITGYIFLATYKTDTEAESTNYITSNDNKFKDLYLTKIIERYIMEDLM
jgi:hypothetical protein